LARIFVKSLAKLENLTRKIQCASYVPELSELQFYVGKEKIFVQENWYFRNKFFPSIFYFPNKTFCIFAIITTTKHENKCCNPGAF